MTEQSTPSDLAAWVLDHGVGLIPARQKQLAKGYRRLEAQSDIRGRAVVMYRERAREAEARIRDLAQEVLDERGAALDQMEQVQIRDARIKAVQDVLDQAEASINRHPAYTFSGQRMDPIVNGADIRRALDN